MLTMITYIALGLAGLVAVVVAYASTRPDSFRVERSKAIAAPPEAIFPLINDLTAFATWSPFETKDPGMQRVFSGPERGVGQRYDWNGNRNVGKGWLAITGSHPSSQVDIALNMLAPMTATNKVTFTLVPEDSVTMVTWAMQGTVPLFGKVLHLFVNMDRMCGDTFDEGLTTLKRVVEGRQMATART